jgi:catechol 2,3-dioxygenase-like lactoylglutathione lyase family enzyme
MPASFNHTIIAARDRREPAAFLRDLIELSDAPGWGPFTNLVLPDGVLLQFAEPSIDLIQPQPYAFLVDEDVFDRALARLIAQGREFWADTQRTRPGQTNTEHGGRGVYFLDPTGHYLELTTRPYV